MYFSEALNQHNVLSMPSSCASRPTIFRYLNLTLSRFFVKPKIIDSCKNEKNCYYLSLDSSKKYLTDYDPQLPQNCTTFAEFEAHHAIHRSLYVGSKACKPLLKIVAVKLHRIRGEYSLCNHGPACIFCT